MRSIRRGRRSRLIVDNATINFDKEVKIDFEEKEAGDINAKNFSKTTTIQNKKVSNQGLITLSTTSIDNSMAEMIPLSKNGRISNL
jgi:hypothetical protein